MLKKLLGLALLLVANSVFAQSSAQIEANKGVLKVSPTAQLPSPCRIGQLWFDSTTATPKTCNDGTNWTTIGGGSITIGTTPIVGGATTQILYNLAGVVSSDSGFLRTGVNGTTTIDNGSGAVSILVLKDNNTPTFTVNDGGGWTVNSTTASATLYDFQSSGTSVLSIGSGTNGAMFGQGAQIPDNKELRIGTTAGNSGSLWFLTGQTPDTNGLLTGTVSNAWVIFESADTGFDFQNACTTGLGTSSCTDPTLSVRSHNQDTGEFLSMAHDGKAGVIVGGNSTVLDGTIRLGGTVTLTESSATAVLTVPVAVSTGTGGEIIYSVEAKDATNTQIRAGKILFAVANNSSGTETCNAFGIVTTQAAGGDTTNAANPTQVQDGSGVGAITSGTLTYAWSVDTTGTNNCVLKLNAVSSLTQTTFQIHYTVIQSGPGISTGS